MTDLSLYGRTRRLGFTIDRLMMQAGQAAPDGLSVVAAKSLDRCKRSMRLAQDATKSYEMFTLEEDTRMQARSLVKTISALEKVRESLLQASEYDAIGAVDVAQISAELDTLIDSLR